MENGTYWYQFLFYLYFPKGESIKKIAKNKGNSAQLPINYDQL